MKPQGESVSRRRRPRTLMFQEPWLGAIDRGDKTTEIRLADSAFARSASVGDVFNGKSQERCISLEITGVEFFDSFGDAWVGLGPAMGVDSVFSKPSHSKVQKLYEDCFYRGRSFPPEKGSIVAVHVRKVRG